MLTHQKSELSAKLKELTSDNDSLKLKFSQLLDQFQEYVNESERKIEEDQYNQHAHQEKLLSELNCTIKDLEDINSGLQREVTDKTNRI